MSTIKAATGPLLLFIISVVVTLCLLEVLIRRFYPQPLHYYNFTHIQTAGGAEMVLGHRMPTVAQKRQGYGPYIPNLSTKFGGVQISINSRGWRDAEHILEKRDNVTRIMVVGDSVAFGYGVELEETFSKVLEREVNRRGVGRYEVMTFGGAGGNTYSQKNVIEGVVPLYRPDLIIVAFNLNDIVPKRIKKIRDSSLGSGASLARKIVRLRRKLDGVFRSRSHLYFLARERTKAALRHFGIASPAMVRMAAFDLDTDYALSAWRDTSSALLEIAAELRNKNIPLLIAVLPIDMQMSAEVADIYRRQFGFKFAETLVEGKPQKIICDFASQHGIACLDLLPAFRKYPDENRFFRLYGGSVDWNHPNRVGHKIIGEELARVLKPFARARGLLGERRELLPARRTINGQTAGASVTVRNVVLQINRPHSRQKDEEMK